MIETIPSCISCDTNESVKYSFEKDSYNIYKCFKCGLHFVWPLPALKELTKIYDESYFKRGDKYNLDDTCLENSAMSLNESQRLKEIIDVGPKEGKLLDVGCATGDFLKEAQGMGFDCTGIDISSFATTKAKNTTKAEIHKGDLLDTNFASESFDIVTMWDVVEHLNDPVAYFCEVNRILRPGGAFVFTTGDIGSLFARLSGQYWHLLTPPQHLFFFTSTSLVNMLKRLGFNTRKLSHPSRKVTFGFMGFKAREIFGHFGMPISLVVKCFNLNKTCININLYDIMMVNAIKHSSSES